MARKRKTLPSNFAEILESGDLDAMKAVYDTCLLDATTGYYKRTALALVESPPELVRWLVEQGLDIDVQDHFGYTPLAAAASNWDTPRMRLLLELGANPNPESRYLPLMIAANSYRVEAVRLLLEHGANIHALEWPHDYTAADKAVAHSYGGYKLPYIVETLSFLLDAGAHLTDDGRCFVAQLGKEHAQTARLRKENTDGTRAVDAAMSELYRLSGVPPVQLIEAHDGTSRIEVPDLPVRKQFSWLWDYLVPMGGPAETVQGEVVRIAGRIGGELFNNGGGNWDDDYRAMCDTWLDIVRTHAAAIASLRRGLLDEAALKAIEAASVQYVIEHPDPVPNSSELPYQR